MIAMHTQHSIGPQHTILSKWIPYELGRAKARQFAPIKLHVVRSTNAALGVRRICILVVHTRAESEIDNWLKMKKGPCKLSKNSTPAGANA